MLPLDFISTARRQLGRRRGKPRQADLRRALSTAYYAFFHAVCRNCADSLVGKTASSRNEQAWGQAYRAVEHGFARNQFRNKIIRENFPVNLLDLADTFVELQSKRHKADYDPLHRVTRSDVLNGIHSAEAGIKKLQKSNLKDRRAFAVWTITKKRAE